MISQFSHGLGIVGQGGNLGVDVDFGLAPVDLEELRWILPLKNSEFFVGYVVLGMNYVLK